MNENGLNYIDLFAGAGGLSEGFIQSGYRPVAHVEMNEHAAKTIETRIAYYYLKDKGLEKEGIFIKSYSDLLAEARRYNDDLYKMYEDISMKKNNKSDK